MQTNKNIPLQEKIDALRSRLGDGIEVHVSMTNGLLIAGQLMGIHPSTIVVVGIERHLLGRHRISDLTVVQI